MKAWLLHQPGSWRAMTLGEVVQPRPGPGEIRVQTRAVGLNPVDFKLARSGYPAWRYPFILGLDVAGVADEVGEGVERWRPGDRVFYHGDLSKPGGFAELALAQAHTVAAIPAGISFAEAASLPCAGLTAYHALFRRLHVRAGDTILVQAGAGGVGGFAIELARHAGLRVFTTCSARNAEYVRALGAELAFDYRTADIKQAVLEATGGRGVDAVVESLGPESATRCLEMLAFNGGMACVSGLPDLSRLAPFTVSPSLHEVSLGGAHLRGDRQAQADLATMAEELAGLVVAGAIQPLPIEILPWEQLPDGLDRLAEGHVRGKIVVQIGSR
jgi:NADPH2:quinone reductase